MHTAYCLLNIGARAEKPPPPTPGPKPRRAAGNCAPAVTAPAEELQYENLPSLDPVYSPRAEWDATDEGEFAESAV